MNHAPKALMECTAGHAGGGQPLRIERIAGRSGTPKRFPVHVLPEMRNAGLIASVRGRHGGYVLTSSPREVPLTALVRLIDRPLALSPCLPRRACPRCEDCPDEETSRLRKVTPKASPTGTT
jgi:Rrf2 family protein